MATGEPIRRSRGLRNLTVAAWPLLFPWTRSSSIVQSVFPFGSASAISTSENRGDDSRHDMAEPKNKASDDYGHRHVALRHQVVKVELRRQPIKYFIAE